MKKALSLLASASLILFLSGCVSGTGAGVDPTPGDDNDESGAFGDGPTDGALGGAAPSSSSGANVAQLCVNDCNQQEECGVLDDGDTVESCIAECSEEAATFMSMLSQECQAAASKLAACTSSLSCEDLEIYSDPGFERESEGSYPCFQEEMEMSEICADDLDDVFGEDYDYDEYDDEEAVTTVEIDVETGEESEVPPSRVDPEDEEEEGEDTESSDKEDGDASDGEEASTELPEEEDAEELPDEDAEDEDAEELPGDEGEDEEGSD